MQFNFGFISFCMKIPFSIDQFLSVFESYNRSLWPVQLVLYGLGVTAILLVWRKTAMSNQLVFSILAFFWLWMGSVYHILYFSAINKAAYVFGFVFILQGLILFYFGLVKQKIKLVFNIEFSGVIGIVLVIYAMIIYPLFGNVMGHVYPRSPTFGVPCPTTIFTFGLLLFSVNRIPWYIILIPLLWSFVGFFAAINLSIVEDFGLVIAGIISSVIILFLKPRSKK